MIGTRASEGGTTVPQAQPIEMALDTLRGREGYLAELVTALEEKLNVLRSTAPRAMDKMSEAPALSGSSPLLQRLVDTNDKLSRTAARVEAMLRDIEL